MMRNLPDHELVTWTRAGHRDAFGCLVERYQDSLFRYARHMGFDDADARDIVQDAFVRAYRHLGRCGDPSRFDGWLFTIVSNLCRTAGAKATRRKFQSLEATELPDDSPGPDRRAEAASNRARIEAALAKLPTDQREAVVLFYLRDHSVREISGLTGASPSAIKMRLRRARESLKADLEPFFDEAAA